MSESSKQCPVCLKWYPRTSEYFNSHSDHISYCRGCDRAYSFCYQEALRGLRRRHSTEFDILLNRALQGYGLSAVADRRESRLKNSPGRRLVAVG